MRMRLEDLCSSTRTGFDSRVTENNEYERVQGGPFTTEQGNPTLELELLLLHSRSPDPGVLRDGRGVPDNNKNFLRGYICLLRNHEFVITVQQSNDLEHFLPEGKTQTLKTKRSNTKRLM